MGEWKVERPAGAKYIYLMFKGEMVAAEGDASAKKAKALIGSDSVAIVADFMELQKYETQVRLAWQKTLWPARKQLTGVTVATNNLLVRMGVTTFAMFMGLPARIVDSKEELAAIVASLETRAS